MSYSEVSDLLVGDTRLDGVISKQAYVDAAADEIDGFLGGMYETPVVVSGDAVSRSTMLMLKTINNWLATGRIILTISRTGEDNNLDALGKYYVEMAMERLKQIANGTIKLPGATSTSPAGPNSRGPQHANSDKESLVDAFYNNFNPTNPGYLISPPRVYNPTGF